jgi:catechol 2,3-dioxygenase-like lactoylglutathione lyase family enzyme
MYLGPVAKRGDPPTVGHVAFGLSDFWAQKSAMQAELERREAHVRPDGEGGWTFDEPARFMNPGMQVTPLSDPSMFPGSERPCAVAESDACRAAWKAGVAKAGGVPKATGKGFEAAAFSHIVFEVPDVARERDFYAGLWGMKVVSEKPGEECLLRFGPNTLEIRESSAKPRCNSYGFAIENFDKAKVEAELKRRGLEPQADPKWAFAIKDPDGLVIGVTDKA